MKCPESGPRWTVLAVGNLRKRPPIKDPGNRRNFLTSPHGFLSGSPRSQKSHPPGAESPSYGAHGIAQPRRSDRSESMKFPQIEPPTTCLSLGKPPQKCPRSRISRIVVISFPPLTDFCRDRQDRKSASLIDPNPHARGRCVARANARHNRTRPKSIRARKRTRHHAPNPIDSMRAHKCAR